MRSFDRTNRFKRDYKRERRTDPGIEKLLGEVIHLLIRGDPLPERLRDHGLSGAWNGYRDCHIKPDLVLIYKITDDAVILVRIGSHSELFD